MNAGTFKVLVAIIAFIVVIIMVIMNAKKQRKKEELDDKSTKIDVDTKDDTYWEARFNGLREDYENREKYHNNRYEQLKAEFASREQFLRDMLNDSRSEYQTLKQEIQSITECKNQIEEKLRVANKIIADYEIRNMKIAAKLREFDPNWPGLETSNEEENE